MRRLSIWYFKIQHCGDGIVIVFYLLYSTTFRIYRTFFLEQIDFLKLKNKQTTFLDLALSFVVASFAENVLGTRSNINRRA